MVSRIIRSDNFFSVNVIRSNRDGFIDLKYLEMFIL